ncbi:MAG: HPF/RaiA family ribosome-associated protein [Ferruginibacter sp.]
MNYTENFDGIKMDIQTVDITISEQLQEDIREMIKRLQRHISEINWVDAYFKMESKRSTDVRMLSVRLGIPGRDVFASESGYYWQALLKNAEIKLRRQLRRKLVPR